MDDYRKGEAGDGELRWGSGLLRFAVTGRKSLGLIFSVDGASSRAVGVGVREDHKGRVSSLGHVRILRISLRAVPSDRDARNISFFF